jgi:hypothetical protein
MRFAFNRRFFNRFQRGFRLFLQAIIDRHGHAALLRGCRVSVRNNRVFPHNAAAKANKMNERTGTICGGGGNGGGGVGGGNCLSSSALAAVFTNHAVEFTLLLKNHDASSLLVVRHYLSPQENGNLQARPHAFTPPLEDRKLS